MKIPEEYGGLGLTQVYYNRALALAGTWHASISTLLSAHQSIGLPEPLKTYGSEEQKREWLPKVATDHISAFLLTEPDVGSDPARMSRHRGRPTEDGSGYLINGTKLWATNGVIADVVVVMAVVPKREGPRAASPPSSARWTPRASPSCTATSSWACGGSRTPSPGSRMCRPQGERHRRRGPWPEDRAGHAQHRTAVASGDLRRGLQVFAEDRSPVGGRAPPVGSAAG